MTPTDYWLECILDAADQCELSMTDEQAQVMAESVSSAHDNYGLAFYSPPSTDRIADIEREWAEKLRLKQAELDKYQANAEEAIRRALKQFPDAVLSIGEYGDVYKHGGRTEQIQ